MSLEPARTKAAEQIILAKDITNEKDVIQYLKLWLKALKLWEGDETFARAFSENRMCARVAPVDKIPGVVGTQKKQSFTTQKVQKDEDVTIRASVGSVPMYLNKDNFLEKKKNALGLHDVSAVLLSSEEDISKQLFSKVGRQPIFIPIPHEEDLQLLYEIEQVAKANRAGHVYGFYKEARAEITRIKYGSDEDMKTTFLKWEDEKGLHYRYGDAHETAGPVSAEILQTRRMNALKYKSKILTGNKVDNNEVTLKIRSHAGPWPQAAIPGPVKKSEMPGLPCDIPAEQFLMIGFDKTFRGLVDNKGNVNAIK